MKLTGLSGYYLEGRESCPPNTVIVGYAGLKDRDVPALTAALRRAWRADLPAGDPVSIPSARAK